jgi:hypothetical protein
MAGLVDTRMPGVYTVEVPTLPPSIALVPSAVPCFIGYTEKAEKDGEDLTLVPKRIKNMREYEAWFGTSPNQDITVDINESVDYSDPNNPKTTGIDVSIVSISNLTFRMHYAMQLYYSNGGGPCYIISVGKHTGSTPNAAALNAGIDAAKLSKDVTILLFPDACQNLSDDDYYRDVANYAMLHCEKMKNRVVVIDVNDKNEDNEDITKNFRSKIPQSINQKYVAAYYPSLATTLDYKYGDANVEIRFHKRNNDLDTDTKAVKTALDDYLVAQMKALASKSEEDILILINKTIDNEILAKPAITPIELESVSKKAIKKEFKLNAIPTGPAVAFTKADATAVDGEINTQLATASTKANTDKTDADSKQTTYGTLVTAQKAAPFSDTDFSFRTLDKIKDKNNLIYNRIREAINNAPVMMPPSAAIAALYVQTDATQGVWKAPANLGLGAVVKPTVEIDDDFHADLNVDANSGKSVNAIRAYEGRGILVFGARTLAGNDLEWRYVSVRRTFCFIEDAIGRAMQNFIFEPNTRDTWIKVKAMISNFLIDIWKAGGLFGNTTNEAFQVNVGLPETMSDVDILEGKMIVEIKLRVSRPAEFIILRYEHKFQANAA